MSNITKSSQNLRWMDNQSDKNTIIHRINPVIKLVVSLIYIFTIISFDNYSPERLIPFIFYIFIVSSLAEISLIHLLKLSAVSLPLIIGIGIFNPIFNREVAYYIGSIPISFGMLSFCTLFIKSLMTVISGLLLVATTGINNLGMALRKIGLPKIFAVQIMLTYRYITVYMEEVNTTLTAHSLRANNKGVSYKSYGYLVGNILLRTIDRSQKIYEAMCLRGFHGDYVTGKNPKINKTDIIYLAVWSSLFIFIRYYNLSQIIGNLIIGEF